MYIHLAELFQFLLQHFLTSISLVIFKDTLAFWYLLSFHVYLYSHITKMNVDQLSTPSNTLFSLISCMIFTDLSIKHHHKSYTARQTPISSSKTRLKSVNAAIVDPLNSPLKSKGPSISHRNWAPFVGRGPLVPKGGEVTHGSRIAGVTLVDEGKRNFRVVEMWERNCLEWDSLARQIYIYSYIFKFK